LNQVAPTMGAYLRIAWISRPAKWAIYIRSLGSNLA
jgi:hypothetical protein